MPDIEVVVTVAVWSTRSSGWFVVHADAAPPAMAKLALIPSVSFCRFTVRVVDAAE